MNKLPKGLQKKAKGRLQDIWMAETRKDAESAFDFFLEAYGPKYDKAAACLAKDRDVLLTFYGLCQVNRIHSEIPVNRQWLLYVNFNGLVSWRNAENSLQSVNLMVWMPPFRRRVRQNGVWFELQTEGASTMDITTIGFDLAKTVFQVHGADGEGRVVLRRKLRRGKVLAFFAGLPSCLVGMEACASAHYWARELQALGHKVRLIPPQYVRPFVKTNKNDAADAEAICEAVTRPSDALYTGEKRRAAIGFDAAPGP